MKRKMPRSKGKTNGGGAALGTGNVIGVGGGGAITCTKNATSTDGVTNAWNDHVIDAIIEDMVASKKEE